MNKSTLLPIKIKLYHKANRASSNSSLSKQLAILEDMITNLISSDNLHPINFINNAANILTGTIMNIHNHLSASSTPYQTKKKKLKECLLNPEIIFSKGLRTLYPKKLKNK